jgi:vitamin B12 transporter
MTSIVLRHAAPATKPLVMALAIAAAFSCSAWAQTRQTETLAPVTVTAARMPQNARDVLSDNIIITREEIAQAGQGTLVDLLQRQRGVEITRNGGPGTASSVFIRGADNKQNIVLVDGVRVGSSTLGGATWAAIPLSQIDHVEIVYGPLSTLYGADAIGGVVQIFTKKGDGAPQLSASAGYGSYATRALEAGVAGATAGEHRIRYALSAAHEASDGFSATKPGNFSFNPDKDGYTKDSASGQLSLELAKGHEIGLSFLQSKLDAQVDLGASASDARGISRLGSYALYSKNQLLPNWSSQLQLSQGVDKSGSIFGASVSSANTTQNELSWQNDFTFGTDVLQLLIGRREEKIDTTTAVVNGTRSTNSIAASYQLKRGAHLASAGIRTDDSSQYGSQTTGNIGYGYRITNALRANASVGTSFRAPTFNELYFPGFGIATNKPERGKNLDAGLYYEDGKSQFSVVYFRNRLTDLLVFAPTCPVEPATHPFGCAYNVDKALLTGISLGASTRLGDFTVRGSLDLQNPRDETTDKLLPRRARQHGSLALEYAAGMIKAGAESVFSGKRYDDGGNNNPMGGYGLLNLYASYDFARNWSLFGRWNNVLDKNYELAKNYATAGSNLFVGVRYGM